MVWLPTPSFKHFICHDLMNSIASESKSWIFDMEMQYYYLGRSTFSSSSLAKCQIRYSNFESDTVSYLYMFDYRLSKLGMCYVFLQDDWLRKRELLMIQVKFFLFIYPGSICTLIWQKWCAPQSQTHDKIFTQQPVHV